jgi:hypothetical protein
MARAAKSIKRTLDAPWALAALGVAYLVRRRLRLSNSPPAGNVVA